MKEGKASRLCLDAVFPDAPVPSLPQNPELAYWTQYTPGGIRIVGLSIRSPTHPKGKRIPMPLPRRNLDKGKKHYVLLEKDNRQTCERTRESNRYFQGSIGPYLELTKI